MQSHIVIKESANFSDVTGDSTEPEDCCDQGLGMGSCQALVVQTSRLGIWEMAEPDGLLYLFSFTFLLVS
jgi:hypothetical protein